MSHELARRNSPAIADGNVGHRRAPGSAAGSCRGAVPASPAEVGQDQLQNEEGVSAMKTVIRFRDDQGRIMTAREEELPSANRVLVRFSIAMFVLWLLLGCLI